MSRTPIDTHEDDDTGVDLSAPAGPIGGEGKRHNDLNKDDV